MQILETESKVYKLSVSGYKQKTPVILKYIADGILALIPVVDGIMLSAPDFPKKDLIMFLWSTFGIVFKFLTKFVTEFPKFEEEEELE